MALLGGLFRGTTGAFIRGGLGAASDILEQTALRDDEEAKNRVTRFGEAKKTYDTNMAAYQEEVDLINEVATNLGGQSDEFLKDLSEAEIQSVAQSLISLSGAKNAGDAMNYFLEKRNELGTFNLPGPTKAPATPSVDKQTTAAMAPAQEPSGFMGAMGRAFSGMSNEELDAKAAADMGVSVETYRQVMGGRTPSVVSPSMILTVGKEDPIAQTISDSHSNILTIFRQSGDDRVINDNTKITLADGTELVGNDIRAEYMKNYKSFLKDPKANVEALYEMQSKVITLAIPDMGVQEYIKAFDDEVTDIRKAAHNLDLPDEVRGQLMDIHKQLVDKKSTIFLDSASVTNDDAKAYETLISNAFGLMADIPSKPGELKMPDILINANKQLERYEAVFADPSKKIAFDDEDKAAMVRARTLINSAATDVTGKDLVNALGVIQDEINKISLSEIDTSSGPTKLEQRIALAMTMLDEAGFQGSAKQKREVAERHARSDAQLGSVIRDGDYQLQIVLDANGNLATKPVYHFQESSSQRVAPPNVAKNANKTIDNTIGSMATIGRLNVALRNVPELFNVLGEGRIYLSDFADFFGRPDLAEQFKGSVVENAQRDAISFIKAAKDDIFDDPRLSDQDLFLIKRYVGLLDQPTIGATRAAGALQGLMRVFATSQALAYADKFMDAKAIEYVGIEGFDPNSPTAVMDLKKDSIGRMVLTNMLESNRVPGASDPHAFLEKLKEDDIANGRVDANGQPNGKSIAYVQTIAPYMDMATNAARAVVARRRNPESYKSTWKTAGLPDPNTM